MKLNLPILLLACLCGCSKPQSDESFSAPALKPDRITFEEINITALPFYAYIATDRVTSNQYLLIREGGQTMVIQKLENLQ